MLKFQCYNAACDLRLFSVFLTTWIYLFILELFVLDFFFALFRFSVTQ